MVQVRFRQTKRFPHPDGPKRRPGEVVFMPADLAELWERATIVERVKPKQAEQAPPKAVKAAPKSASKRTKKGG